MKFKSCCVAMVVTTIYAIVTAVSIFVTNVMFQEVITQP